MLNNIFTEISIQLKLKIRGEFGHVLGIVGKPVEGVGFNEGDLEIFRPKVIGRY
jgi:hypothetical protein